MHFVSFYFFTFHGLEGACTYVQGQFFAVDTVGIQCLQYAFGEVQSGGGGGYRPFYFGIDRLISFFIAFLCVSVEVGRNRQFAHHFQQVGKGDAVIIPFKIYPMACAATFTACGSQCHLFPFHVYHAAQCSFFPFLQIANHAEPAAFFRLLEGQYIIVRLYRLQTEHFNQSSCFLAKVQACLNHLCIVEYHQFALLQIFRQRSECIFAYFAVAVYQQLGLVTYCQRKLCNPFIGQRVIVFAYFDMFCIFHLISFHNLRKSTDVCSAHCISVFYFLNVTKLVRACFSSNLTKVTIIFYLIHPPFIFYPFQFFSNPYIMRIEDLPG